MPKITYESIGPMERVYPSRYIVGEQYYDADGKEYTYGLLKVGEGSINLHAVFVDEDNRCTMSHKMEVYKRINPPDTYSGNRKNNILWGV